MSDRRLMLVDSKKKPMQTKTKQSWDRLYKQYSVSPCATILTTLVITLSNGSCINYYLVFQE